MVGEHLRRLRKAQNIQVEPLPGDDALLAFITRSENGEYLVTVLDNMIRCECPDYQYRHGDEGSYICKHCWAVLQHILNESYEEYGDHECMRTFKVPAWLAEEKGLTRERVTGTIEHETPKAILLRTPKGESYWLPKSQIHEERIPADQTTLGVKG